MSKHIPFILAVSFWLYLSTSHAGFCADPVSTAWREAHSGGSFTEISIAELDKAEKLFRGIFSGDPLPQLSDEAIRLGLELQPLTVNNKSLLMLREHVDKKNGRGFYLFNSKSSNQHLVMTPHAFKDVGTGTIVLKLFIENDFSTLALNTIPRYIKLGGGKKQIHDLGKLPGTYFVALTKAFLAVNKDGNIYQIHGFATKKRTSPAGAEAGIILSGGTKFIRQDIQALQPCLQNVFTQKTLIYPRDVHELGGTTNIMGKILREHGHNGFFHIEINRTLRDTLLTEAPLRKSFGKCLELQQ